MYSYEELVDYQVKADNGLLLLFISTGIVAILYYLFCKKRQMPKLAYLSLSLYWILPIALLLRLPLMFQSLWYDEAFTSAIASLSAFKALIVVMADVHPPLAYLPFWFVAQFAGSFNWLLRLPSLIAGIASIWALYRLGKQWGKNTGRMAALLGALMPAMMWYSTEARAYAFLLLAVLVVFIALEEKRPLILAWSLGLLPLLHVYGYLYAGLFGAYALWQDKSSIKNLIAAAIPALLWLPFMMAQSNDVSDGFWLGAPTLGFALKPLIEMQIGTAFPPFVAWIAIPSIIFVSVLALIYNFEKRMMAYWLIFAGVPLIAFILSWLWHPIYLPRALLPSVAILIIFFARWIVAERSVAAAFLYLAFALVLPYKLVHPSAARFDLASFVADCEQRPIFALSIESAIIADALSTNEISLYSDWNNLNQSLSPEAVNALGYRIQNSPQTGACIYWQQTPMTTTSQLNQKEFITFALQMTCTVQQGNEFYIVETCK